MRKRYLMFFLVVMFVTAACQKNRSTDTYSTEFSTEREKIAFLKYYVKCFSPVSATEFHIVYYDNSTGLVPGPSDWEFNIAVRIEPIDSAKWIVDFQKVKEAEIELSWIADIPLDEARWTRSSTPQYYRRQKGNVVLIVYEEEGIILKHMRSQ